MIAPERKHTIIPVVTPMTDDPATSGRIRNLSCGPTIGHDWLMRDESGYALRPAWSRAGYVLLRDLYEQERNLAGWEKFEAFIAAWQAGKARKKPFPVAELPREVRLRQACGDAEALEEAGRRSPPTTGKVSTSKPAKD